MNRQRVSIPFQAWPDAIKGRWRVGVLCKVPRWSATTEQGAMAGYGYWLLATLG